MEIIGMILHYLGLLMLVVSVAKFTFNYAGKVGTKASKKVYKNESHEAQDENIDMINQWLKSNIKRIVISLVITIIGTAILLIKNPKLLLWG